MKKILGATMIVAAAFAGSASAMDAWKRQLRKLEADYRKRRCKRHGKDFW